MVQQFLITLLTRKNKTHSWKTINQQTEEIIISFAFGLVFVTFWFALVKKSYCVTQPAWLENVHQLMKAHLEADGFDDYNCDCCGKIYGEGEEYASESHKHDEQITALKTKDEPNL